MAFPKASFVARAIRGLGGGRYEARGPLTIKGVSREMVSVFTLRTDATGAWAEGGFVLPRLQFRIGEGEWADTDTVADAVQIRFKLYLTTKK
jgi:polyisoprenoid-binding protein YceI